jgi:hypothetical protein
MAQVTVNEFITPNYASFSSVDKFTAWSAALDHMTKNPDNWHVQSCEVGLCGQPHGSMFILKRGLAHPDYAKGFDDEKGKENMDCNERT